MAKTGGGNNLIWLGGLTVAGYFVYEHYFSPAVVTPAATTPVPGVSHPAGTPAATPAGTPPVSVVAPSQLDVIYTALKAAAQPDEQFTGSGDSLSGLPFHWDFYLQRVYPGNRPDVSTLFDVSTPVTAAAFWAKEAPSLKAANPGLGLGFFGGLGAVWGMR